MIRIVQPNEVSENEVVETEIVPAAVQETETVTGEHFEMTEEQYEMLVSYLKIESGALIEIGFLIKAFIIMYIIIQGWRLVRK